MTDSVQVRRVSEEWNLETYRLGRHVWVFDQVDSTNTLALELARDPANDGLVLLAREQTSGRGQHGRTWHAPPESSVLLSALLFPPLEICRPALLTAWAAVSVCRLIAALTGSRAAIKWPNDVLLDGRKVCGILIEQRTVGAKLATVAGIGLNVNQAPSDFAAAGLADATSLAIHAGRSFDWQTIARQFIHTLDDEYDRLHQGDFDRLLLAWNAGLGLLGRRVMLETHGESIAGHLRELTFASLDVELPGGDLIRLVPEKVKHVNLMPD
jgi:BirA family biotin operon repressor/biotin-[acetyl-CoA-carboxylase] ligase